MALKPERLCAINTTYHIYDQMISMDHIFDSWNYFKRGKQKRKDIKIFERFLEDNIFDLHNDLKHQKYQHGCYKQFYVTDPKQRHISKASVKDRLVHQMVYSSLNKIFDKKFIFHTFSCRLGKGAHLGIEQLSKMIQKVSANGNKPCYALKMDIRRFFDSIDHGMLKILIENTL